MHVRRRHPSRPIGAVSRPDSSASGGSTRTPSIFPRRCSSSRQPVWRFCSPACGREMAHCRRLATRHTTLSRDDRPRTSSISFSGWNRVAPLHPTPPLSCRHVVGYVITVTGPDVKQFYRLIARRFLAEKRYFAGGSHRHAEEAGSRTHSHGGEGTRRPFSEAVRMTWEDREGTGLSMRALCSPENGKRDIVGDHRGQARYFTRSSCHSRLRGVLGPGGGHRARGASRDVRPHHRGRPQLPRQRSRGPQFARGELRPAGVCERVPQAVLPGRLLRGPAEQPAHGVLPPGYHRARRRAPRAGDPGHRREPVGLALHHRGWGRGPRRPRGGWLITTSRSIATRGRRCASGSAT